MTKYDGKYWMSQIKAAWKFRKEYGRADKWDRWRGYYQGDWFDLHSDHMDSGILPVNLIFSFGRTYISKMVSSYPEILVKPLTMETGGIAMLVEQVLRMLVLNLPIVQNMRRVVQDAYLLGTGMIKRGYDSQFGYFPTLPDGKTGRKGETIEQKGAIHNGMPWAMWQQLEDCLVPYGVVRDEDVWFQAFKMYRRVDDMKADPRVKNNKDIIGSARPIKKKALDKPESSQQMLLQLGYDGEEPPAEWFAYWELHDMRRHRVIWLNPQNEKILLDEPDELTLEGEPVGYSLRLNDNNLCWWGLSDVHNLEPQQLEINDIRTQQAMARRVAILKFMVRKGMISPQELSKLMTGGPNICVEVDGDLEKIIKEIRPPVPFDLGHLSEEVRKDMREMVGLSRNQQGVFAGARATATEANVVNAASEESMDDRRNVVNRMWADLMKGLLDSARRFWTEPQTLALIGPDEQPLWVEFKGQDLAGKFAIDIDVASGIPFSQQMRRQELERVMSIGGPAAMTPELLKYYAATFPYLDKSKLFAPHAGPGGSPDKPMGAGDFNALVEQGG